MHIRLFLLCDNYIACMQIIPVPQTAPFDCRMGGKFNLGKFFH